MLMWTENANANALTFQLVEYFSGKGRVSRVFRKAKKMVASFELKTSRAMDFNSQAGFLFLWLHWHLPIAGKLVETICCISG